MKNKYKNANDYCSVNKYGIPLKIITVCTDQNNEQLNNWENSVVDNRYDYEILGLGEKWGGWSWRTKKYIEELERETHHIYCLTDATDLFFVDGPDKLLDSFLSYNTNILIGGENTCCTGEAKLNLIKRKNIMDIMDDIEQRSRYKYPNGGFVMGYREDLLDLLYKNKDYFDDQEGYLMMWIKSGGKEFTIDIGVRCVGNIGLNYSHFGNKNERDESKSWTIIDGKVVNMFTKTAPPVLHFPGGNIGMYNYLGYELFGDSFYPAKQSIYTSIKKSWGNVIKSNIF